MAKRVYAAKHRAQKQSYYQAVRAEGDCWLCRNVSADPDSPYCDACRASRARKKREAKTNG